MGRGRGGECMPGKAHLLGGIIEGAKAVRVEGRGISPVGGVGLRGASFLPDASASTVKSKVKSSAGSEEV